MEPVKPSKALLTIAVGVVVFLIVGILVWPETALSVWQSLRPRTQTAAQTKPTRPAVVHPAPAAEPIAMNTLSVALPIPPKPASARILFVGDIMLDRNVAARSKADGSLAYPFARLPEHWFDSFDYSVANLEGPVTDKRRPPVKTIDFQFDPSVIPVLQTEGIKAFSQGNNHALDQGSIGFDDSRQRLQDAGFLVFGHQVDDGSIAVATTTVNGIRFAFLGFNITDNALDRTAAADDLAQARASSDRVIVFMHWGTEYHDRPDASVVELSHWLIDNGADVVIGGHPHWYQGISVYKNKPIIWSLGNFIFDQDFSEQTRQGLTVALTFDQQQIVLEPMPVQIDMSQPQVVDGQEKTKRLEALAKLSDHNLETQILNGVVVFSSP